MRIVVPIKQVPETSAVKMDEATGTMIREGVEAIINPLDLYAIELAIQLRETYGGEVVTISMGPPKAALAVREAIAMGCDSAVLISDRAFAGSDTWATSYVLSAAIRQLAIESGNVDLIICGERATDGDTGQVGPGIASFLNLPVASYISKVDEIVNGSCHVHRLVEDGYEILQVQLPTVLTVVKEVADPRLPTLRGKQKAKKMDLSVWGAAQLTVEADKIGLNGSPTRVVKIFRPTVARNCEKFFALDEQAIHTAADGVVEYLRAKELI
ncbi:MAG: electron transfer flavoprotein subunit beta/FixA family protein [Syntrophales bacterium]